MSKTRLFLTGGAGMVGRNLLAHPSVLAFEVSAPDRKELDLLDPVALRSHIRDFRPDVIIHAAGRVGGIQANMLEPVRFLVENLDIGRNLVMAARSEGVERLINLGSSCMYPRGCSGALTEDMILKGELEPTNEGYALAKIVTARICAYVREEDLRFQYKTIIPCNLFGRYDKFDPTSSHLIPSIIYKVHHAKQAGLREVVIWGDGKARREFMYSGDLADALVRAITHFESLPFLMNAGVGQDHTIDEYYKAVAEVVGYDGNFRHDLDRPVGMARKLVDTTLQTSWGWGPRSDLRAGIEKTYSYYLEEASK